jgi:uncharacterized protein YxjI
LEVHGNILDHEYTIGEGRDKAAEASKKWFRVRDSYGVEIAQVFVLAQHGFDLDTVYRRLAA